MHGAYARAYERATSGASLASKWSASLPSRNMTTTVPPAYDEWSNPLLVEHANCRHCAAGRMCRERAAELRTWASIAQGRLRDLRDEVARLTVEARLLPVRTPRPPTRRGWRTSRHPHLG